MRRPLTLILVGVCFVCLWLSVLACSPKVDVHPSVQPATFKVHFHGTSMYPTILNDQMGVMQGRMGRTPLSGGKKSGRT
jgi:hypothetical protein